MSNDAKNQGEGDREAARRFNESGEKFAQSGKVEDKSADRRNISAREREALEKAEEAGRSRAAEKDPSVTRDFENPSH